MPKGDPLYPTVNNCNPPTLSSPPPQCGSDGAQEQCVSTIMQLLTCLQHCTQVARGAIEHVIVKAVHSPLGPTGPAALCAAPTHPPCFLHQPPLGLNPLPATCTSHFLNYGACDQSSVLCNPRCCSHISLFCSKPLFSVTSLCQHVCS